MKKLLLLYGFKYDVEYFYMVIESLINGQVTQAHEQIKNLPKEGKKELLRQLTLSSNGLEINDRLNREWMIKHTIELL